MPKQVSKLKCKVNLFQLEPQQNDEVAKNIGNVNCCGYMLHNVTSLHVAFKVV